MLARQTGGSGHLVRKSNNTSTVQILPALFCCNQFSKLTISFSKYRSLNIWNSFMNVPPFWNGFFILNGLDNLDDWRTHPKFCARIPVIKMLLKYFVPLTRSKKLSLDLLSHLIVSDFLAPLLWFTVRQNDLTL